MLDENKTHWLVIQHCYFTGNEYIKERRKTRKGASKAKQSLECYADPDEFMFYIMRNDDDSQRYF